LFVRTAEFFGVRREWLLGVDETIYHHDYCYKRPKRFFSALSSMNYSYSEFPARVLFSGKNLDRTSKRYQPLALLLVEKI